MTKQVVQEKGYERRYKIQRVLEARGESYITVGHRVMVPPQVIRHAAAVAGMDTEKFVETHVAVITYGVGEELSIRFERDQ